MKLIKFSAEFAINVDNIGEVFIQKATAKQNIQVPPAYQVCIGTKSGRLFVVAQYKTPEMAKTEFEKVLKKTEGTNGEEK